MFEVNIDSVGFDTLKTIFSPYDDDPLMYDVYPIKEKEAEQLLRYVDIEFDLSKNTYYVECSELPSDSSDKADQSVERN